MSLQFHTSGGRRSLCRLIAIISIAITLLLVQIPLAHARSERPRLLFGKRGRLLFGRAFLNHPSLHSTSEHESYAVEHLLHDKLRGGASFIGSKNNASDDSTSLSRTTPNQEVSTTKKKQSTKIATISITIFAIILSILNWDTIKSSLSAFFDREKFRTSIIQLLNDIASKGNLGLLLYTLGFIPYEVCGLPTSVVETAAGMAFGFKRGLLGSFVGKTCGSIAAFTLGRTLLSNTVGKKLEENEAISLIERGVAKNPVKSTLIVRYSPFPQLLKNYGLALTKPVSYPLFLLAICIHGFPFSVLWAALGNDSSLRLRASEAGEVMDANVILNGLLVFVTVFGFVVSPAITGWWLAELRRDD